MVRCAKLCIILIIAVSCNSPSSESIEEKVLEVEKDTVGSIDDKLAISFPNDWIIKKNYNGVSILGLSPLDDSADVFKENIVVQTFNLNGNFSNEIVATHLFEEATQSAQGRVIINDEGEWKSKNSIPFYLIEYSYKHKNAKIKSALFCTVDNTKAFMLVCTDMEKTFKANFNDELIEIVQTFKLKDNTPI